MSRSDRRFARFYFDDFIRDYPDIYANDAAFATWWRLLVLAEKAWPGTPELTRSIRQTPLRLLIDRGLVAMGPDHTFAIKGFDVERSRRHALASAAAYAKWDADAGADADASAMLVRERVRKEKKLNETLTGRERAGARLVEPLGETA